MRVLVAVALLLLALGGCSTDAPEPRRDEALRRELLEMQRVDQAERTGDLPTNSDRKHTERLKEIVDKHGWPTSDLVGEDGASAAWLIAQHSDQDVDFQERALELMRAAVADGLADPTELAYLEDRVAVNNDRPQRYGTQVRCRDGKVEPATPIIDEANVDKRRIEVGMDPLADYLAEFAEGCTEPT